MLFEELVKQHRVHLVVAHAVGFSVFVADHQVRIHFFYFLGYQSKLRNALGIERLLVTEGDWFQRKERFAGSFHWLNVVFKPPGGGSGSKSAV